MMRTIASRWPAVIAAAALVLGSNRTASAQTDPAHREHLDPDAAMLRRNVLDVMRIISDQGGSVGDTLPLRNGIALAEALLDPRQPGLPRSRSAVAPRSPAPAPATHEAWISARQRLRDAIDERSYRQAGSSTAACLLQLWDGALASNRAATADLLDTLTRIRESRREKILFLRLPPREPPCRIPLEAQEPAGLVGSLRWMAYDLWLRDRLPEATASAERLLETTERLHGPEDSRLVPALYLLATLREEQAYYRRADVLHRRALRIFARTHGPAHPLIGLFESSLAAVHHSVGAHDQAADAYRRAIPLHEVALGPEHPAVAALLDNLGAALLLQQDHQAAQAVLERAVAVREAVEGPSSARLSLSLAQLAALHTDLGELDLARTLIERALSISAQRGYLLRMAPSKETFETCRRHGCLSASEHARILLRAARVQRARGDDASADDLARQAEQIATQDQTLEAFAMNAEAWDSLAEGRHDEAVQHLARAIEVENRHIAPWLLSTSEDDRRAFMVNLRWTTEQAVSFHARFTPASDAAARLALGTSLHRKARLIEAMAEGLSALRSRPRERFLVDRLQANRAAASSLGVRGPGPAASYEHWQELDELALNDRRIEAAISRRSIALQLDRPPIALEQVQTAIPEGAALIDIVRYHPAQTSATGSEGRDAPASSRAERAASPRYAAYVIRRSGSVRFADLGDAAPIEDTVRALRRELADPRSDPRRLARALDALVMAPVRPLLDGARSLLLSPDGELSLVPFSGLVDEADHYLIERYEFTYLTAGRDIVPLGERPPARRRPLIVAAPAFDGSDTAPACSDARGRRSVKLDDVRFPHLPETALEARDIARVLPGAEVLTGAAASERAIKTVEGPAILHLATHGFFLPVEPSPDLPAEPGAGKLLRHRLAVERRLENRLLRAGLALAGANPPREGKAEDGILTALEVTTLDLTGTRLVVLSGCDTGVGEATQGEGVTGLRRAFELAGAESLLMSLWPVDDEATRELMVGYYQELAAGAGRSEALRDVALRMKRDAATAHPYYWAAFIFSGDRAPLDGLWLTPRVPRVPSGARGCGCVAAGEPRADGVRALSILGLVVLLLGFAGRCLRRRRRGARRLHHEQV